MEIGRENLRVANWKSKIAPQDELKMRFSGESRVNLSQLVPHHLTYSPNPFPVARISTFSFGHRRIWIPWVWANLDCMGEKPGIYLYIEKNLFSVWQMHVVRTGDHDKWKSIKENVENLLGKPPPDYPPECISDETLSTFTCRRMNKHARAFIQFDTSINLGIDHFTWDRWDEYRFGEGGGGRMMVSRLR